MAINATQQQQILQLVQGMVNASPGIVYMGELATMVENNHYTIQQLANVLDDHSYFNTLYSPFLTPEQFAAKLIDNLVGSAVAAADKAWAVTELASMVTGGMSRGDVVWAAVDGLSKATGDANWGNAATQFNNRVSVSQHYTMNGGNATDITTLQSVVTGVTNDPATVTIANAVADHLTTPGTHFTTSLSTAAGADLIRLTGDQMVQINLTNPAVQIRGLDLNANGRIDQDGRENVNPYPLSTTFEIVDAYSRNPLNQNDISQNFLGDINFDGTGFGGDGVSTDGNIYLGGLGVDTAFGGLGNDFMVGGGVALGRFIPQVTSTGGNINFDTSFNRAVTAGQAMGDQIAAGRNADFMFAEISAIDPTDGNNTEFDGGETADNVTGTQNMLVDARGTTNDRDWIMVEASDDNEPVTIELDDKAGGAGALSARSSLTGVGGNAQLADLEGIEAIDASGNLYGFLNDVAVMIGGRAVDARSAAPVAGTENYGIGSTGQLLVTGSASANVVVAGYDNDTVNAAGGNDILFGGNLGYLLANRNNPNLLNANGGLDLNVNSVKVTNDGRDALAGGDDNDAIVFEADAGTVNGNVGYDTLYFTNMSTGRLQGTASGSSYNDATAETDAAKALTTDQVFRFDLADGNLAQFRDYGGANRGLGIAPTVQPTADQTNYVAGVTATTTQNMDAFIATGLGDIDYKAAGSNSPELTFNNQQNYLGSGQRFDVRGVNQDFVGTTKFGTYWTDRNFGQDGISGTLTNADNQAAGGANTFDYNQDGVLSAADDYAVVGNASVARIDIGDNVIFTSSLNDTVEGRLGDDDMGAGRGDDNFVFDNFNDGTDIIRRQSDTNGDNLWDTDAAGNRLYTQDFRAPQAGDLSSSRLTIDFGATDLTSVNVQVAYWSLKIGTAVFSVPYEQLVTAKSATALAAVVNAAYQAVDTDVTCVATGNVLTVTDKEGRVISDTVATGYGVGVILGSGAASTTPTFFPGGTPTNIVENDRILFVDYLNRDNNTWLNNSQEQLRSQAQDLVVGTGSTTTLANDQQWRIQFQNLTEGDKVTVTINGTNVTRTVAAGQTTDAFVAALVVQINGETLDLYTAAGRLAGAQADVNNAVTTESVLVLTQNNIGNGANKVYMSAPTVTIANQLGATSGASWQLANTSDTSIELMNYDGRNGGINGTDVLFLGRSAQTAVAADDKTTQTAQNTALLQFAKTAGETITGKDATVTLMPVGVTSIGTTAAGVGVAGTNLYHAVNGDDQLIGADGNDILNGGTGHDRFILSKGTDTIDGGGNVTAPNGESIRFTDSILAQENDFGAGTKFTITLNSGLDSKGAGTVAAADSKGTNLGTTTFTNVEEIRTASNTAQDTLDYSALSNNIAAATAPSANLNKVYQGGAAYNLYVATPATDYNEGTVLRLTTAGAGFSWAADRNGNDTTLDAGEINANPVAVYGVENIIAGAANDIVVLDETQAGSANSISLAGQQDDLTPAGTYIPGRDLVQYTYAGLAAASRPLMTVQVEAGSGFDSISMTNGALSTSTIIDTLTDVEVLDLAGAATSTIAGANSTGSADTLDLSKISGATVNFSPVASGTTATWASVGQTVGRSQGGQVSPATSVAAVQANTLNAGGVSTTAANLGSELLTIQGITELERITGSAGEDRVLMSTTGNGFVNALANLTGYNDQKIAYNTFNNYTVGTSTYNTALLVDNRFLYQMDLADGTDSLDYRGSANTIAVAVDFAATSPTGDYVNVDVLNNGWNDNGTLDRIDLVKNTERFYGSHATVINNIIDLSRAGEAVTVTFGFENKAAANEVKDPNGIDPNTGATKTPDNQITSIKVGTTSAVNPTAALFMQASANPATGSADYLWGTIEGSNQNETVVFSQYQERLTNNTLNLRGGANTLTYTNAIKTGQSDAYALSVPDLTPVLGANQVHAGYTVTHAGTDGVGTDTISIDRNISSTNVNTSGSLTVNGSSNTNDTVTIAPLGAPNGLNANAAAPTSVNGTPLVFINQGVMQQQAVTALTSATMTNLTTAAAAITAAGGGAAGFTGVVAAGQSGVIAVEATDRIAYYKFTSITADNAITADELTFLGSDATVTDITGVNTALVATLATDDLTGTTKTSATVNEAAHLIDLVGTRKGGYNLVDLGSGTGATSGQIIQDINLNFKGMNAIDDNVLTSTSDFENIIGSANADRLYGNDSNNIIAGGAGNNLLQGRGGGDTLTGGANDDRFVYSNTGDTADTRATSNTAVAGSYDTIVAFDNAGTDYLAFDLTTAAANGGYNLVSNKLFQTSVMSPINLANGSIILNGLDDVDTSANLLDMTTVVTKLGAQATNVAGVTTTGQNALISLDATTAVHWYLWTATSAADTTINANELKLLSIMDDADIAVSVDTLANVLENNAVLGAPDISGANNRIVTISNNDVLTSANMENLTTVATALNAGGNALAAAPGADVRAVFAVDATDRIAYYLFTDDGNNGQTVASNELVYLGSNTTITDIAVGANANVLAEATNLQLSTTPPADGVAVLTESDVAIRQNARATGLADTELFMPGVRDELAYSTLSQSAYGQIDTIGKFIYGQIAGPVFSGIVSGGFENGTDKIDLSAFNLGTADGLALNAIITRDRTGAGSSITDANAADFFYDGSGIRRAVVVEYKNDDIDATMPGVQARARVFVDLNGNGQLDTLTDLFIDFSTNGTSTNGNAGTALATNTGIDAAGATAFGTGFVPGYADFIFMV